MMLAVYFNNKKYYYYYSFPIQSTRATSFQSHSVSQVAGLRHGVAGTVLFLFVSDLFICLRFLEVRNLSGAQ